MAKNKNNNFETKKFNLKNELGPDETNRQTKNKQKNNKQNNPQSFQ